MGRSAVRYSLLENKIKYFTVTQPIRFRRLNPPGIDLGSRAMSAFSTSINTVTYILNLIFYILYTLYTAILHVHGVFHTVLHNFVCVMVV